MRIGYLECFAGISGDMLMAALVDAGAPIDLLQRTAASLDLGAELHVTRVSRSGIQSTKIDVMVDGRLHEPVQPSGPIEHEHNHHHEHSTHHHEPDHKHDHDHKHEHGRSLPEIRALLMHANLTGCARDLSLRTFGLLAEAEGRI